MRSRLKKNVAKHWANRTRINGGRKKKKKKKRGKEKERNKKGGKVEATPREVAR